MEVHVLYWDTSGVLTVCWLRSITREKVAQTDIWSYSATSRAAEPRMEHTSARCNICSCLRWIRMWTPLNQSPSSPSTPFSGHPISSFQQWSSNGRDMAICTSLVILLVRVSKHTKFSHPEDVGNTEPYGATGDYQETPRYIRWLNWGTRCLPGVIWIIFLPCTPGREIVQV